METNQDLSPVALLKAKIAALEADKMELLHALSKIRTGAGPFSLDRIEHAHNCIDAMKDLARAACAKHGYRV